MIENIVRYIEAGDRRLKPRSKARSRSDYGGVVERLAGCSFHPAPVHDWNRRPVISRICDHHECRRRRVGVCFADAYSNDVRGSATRRERSEEREPRANSITRTEEYWTRFRNCTNMGCAGCCAHQRFILIVAVVTLVATILLYIIVPKGLLPQQDTGVIIGVTDAAENHFVQSDDAAASRSIATSFGKDPDVASVSSSVGAGTLNPTVNTARLYIVLKPHDSARTPRKLSSGLRKATRRMSKACRCLCRRRRTCRSIPASAAPNTNTSCRTPTRQSCARGRQSCAKTWATAPAYRCGKRPAENGLQLNVDVDREKARG